MATTARTDQVKEEKSLFDGHAVDPVGVPVKHTVANPAPLGLYAFGLTTALLQGAVTRITEPQPTENLTFCFALGFGGLAQLLAGMFEFVRKNTFAATAFSSYGAFWLGLAFYGILAQAGVWNGDSVSKPRAYTDTHGNQMMLSLWGILTFLFLIMTIRINRALQVLFSSLTLLFFFLAGGKYSPILNIIAGWWGIWVGAVAFYIATAELMTEVWGEKAGGGDYLPLGRYKKGAAAAPRGRSWFGVGRRQPIGHASGTGTPV